MNGTDKKIKKLAQFIRENPSDSFSKFALALEFLKRDQLKKALVLFENIRETEPEYDGVYYHLGKLYERQGRLQQAADTYKEGIQVAANNENKRNVSELKEALAEVEIDLNEE